MSDDLRGANGTLPHQEGLAHAADVGEADEARNALNHYLYPNGNTNFPSWDDVKDRLEKEYLIAILRHTRGNQSKASSVSGLGRGLIRERIQKYHISIDANIR